VLPVEQILWDQRLCPEELLVGLGLPQRPGRFFEWRDHAPVHSLMEPGQEGRVRPVDAQRVGYLQDILVPNGQRQRRGRRQAIPESRGPSRRVGRGSDPDRLGVARVLDGDGQGRGRG
jgi:hypothetical protein